LQIGAHFFYFFFCVESIVSMIRWLIIYRHTRDINACARFGGKGRVDHHQSQPLRWAQCRTILVHSDNKFFCTRHKAILVGIFYSQNKITTQLFG
jgi:hypothetical protein